MTSGWKYIPADSLTPEKSIVVRTLDNGGMESRSINDAEVAAWIADGNVPLPADSDPTPTTFLARDMLAQLTPADYAAIMPAINGSADLGLLWSSLLAQGDAPIETSTQRFKDGWAGLTSVLGADRVAALADALHISPSP
jgi:hypothetical protein